jgi:peroxiredoxin
LTLVVIALVALWLLVILLCAIVYQLILQNGRLLERVDGMEEYITQTLLDPGELDDTRGLHPGAFAPAFELPDLRGEMRSLGEWRGRRVLLIFFDPASSFCRDLLPSLAALAADGLSSRPTPLILSSGDPEENRRLFDAHNVSWPVLIRPDTSVSFAYHVDSTPAGYLVNEDGTLGSEIAAGVQPLLILAGQAPAESNGHGGPAARGKRTIVGRLNREGLPAGTQAPIFRLPDLEGAEHSLLEYRGRKVLLVFSDPHCGPCEMLAPDLEKLNLNRPEGLDIVMISRGDVESNRQKIAEHGFTFPVVLQRHWEVSREYGMFATPIGYLIDEEGVLASDVAVGPDAILELARARPVAAGRRS